MLSEVTSSDTASLGKASMALEGSREELPPWDGQCQLCCSYGLIQRALCQNSVLCLKLG